MKSSFKYAVGATIASAFFAAAVSSAPAAQRIYIPLGDEGAVLIVDPARDIVVGRIDGLPAVHGLAGTPDGRFLIAGSFDEREADEMAPVKPAAVSDADHAAHHARAAEPKATAAAVLSTVSVIRTADRSVVRRIDVPGAVHHVAVSPDASIAVVTHPNQDSISAIDLRNFAVIATVATGALPNYALFSPDGARVYVSSAGDDNIAVIDTADWIVQRTIGVGRSPEHIALSKDGGTLYVNNIDDGTVSVVSLTKAAIARTIAVGDVLHGIDLSDNGQILYVAALGDDKVVAIDLKSGGARELALGPEPYHLTVLRGAGKFYVSSAEAPKIWVVDEGDLAVVREIAVGGKAHQMVRGAGG